MLKADAIAKHYDTPRGRVPILEDVSFSVDRGDALAIMGPSGCGKSTLLYVLGALEPPSDGEMTIDGTNPYALGERQQASFRGATIGFVFQDHLLLPQLSALDNVIAPTLVAGKGRSPADYQARARTLLEEVGLGDRLDHRPGELSGGERQRVAVARALIRHPAVLLCDEPTGNLDRTAADGVADLLLRLHGERKTMMVVVTHSASLASRFKRRYELRDHRLQPA
jgi:lipoprotein-releasing system ATP-binding protein